MSHVHKDTAPLAGSRGRDTLQPAASRRQGLIADWHDGQIEAGNSWKTQIAHQMSTAQIIPLLISADFIDSYFCCEVEMRRAPERHESVEARVIPIILRPCDWEAMPFGYFQALTPTAKPATGGRRWTMRFMQSLPA